MIVYLVKVMSFVKLANTVIVTIILAIFTLVTTASLNLPMDATAESKTSSFALPSSINQIHGTLIVTQKVINFKKRSEDSEKASVKGAKVVTE